MRDLEQKELKHEEVRGYRPIFYTIFAGFVIYTIVIFASNSWEVIGH